MTSSFPHEYRYKYEPEHAHAYELQPNQANHTSAPNQAQESEHEHEYEHIDTTASQQERPLTPFPPYFEPRVCSYDSFGNLEMSTNVYDSQDARDEMEHESGDQHRVRRQGVDIDRTSAAMEADSRETGGSGRGRGRKWPKWRAVYGWALLLAGGVVFVVAMVVWFVCTDETTGQVDEI